MKDQVDNLREKGIKATAVYSGMSRDEISPHSKTAFGDYKFLYVSPERLFFRDLPGKTSGHEHLPAGGG